MGAEGSGGEWFPIYRITFSLKKGKHGAVD